MEVRQTVFPGACWFSRPLAAMWMEDRSGDKSKGQQTTQVTVWDLIAPVCGFSELGLLLKVSEAEPSPKPPARGD